MGRSARPLRVVALFLSHPLRCIRVSRGRCVSDAWRWLQTARPGDELPKLVVNPYRPNRLEPRIRKRRPKSYPFMTKPRCQLKEELGG